MHKISALIAAQRHCVAGAVFVTWWTREQQRSDRCGYSSNLIGSPSL